MAELRPIRAMQLEKVRNLLVAAVTALHDANAPPQYCSAHRRREAAYDAGFSCALALLEANKLEVSSDFGHHALALNFLHDTLKLKGAVAELTPVLIKARNARKYDGSNLCDEAAVARAISWAERILTESEAWFKAHLPQALKS